MRVALALTGAVLTIVALIPYIIDVIRKKTKPNIVSWFTWTLLTSIATAAAFSAGEPETAILTLANAIGTFSIVILGLKNGIAKFTLFDAFCQAGAIVALGFWLGLDSPLIAIVGVVFIDFLGVLPTIKHSWQDPEEETWQTFFLSTVAPLFTITSLTAYQLGKLTVSDVLVASGRLGNGGNPLPT